MALGAAAVLATRGPPVFAMHKLGKTINARFGNNDHAAAIPAIAAIGPTARDVLLAAKAHAAIPAAAGFNFNSDAIDEHGTIRLFQ
jgi:hypothetical protein